MGFVEFVNFLSIFLGAGVLVVSAWFVSGIVVDMVCDLIDRVKKKRGKK